VPDFLSCFFVCRNYSLNCNLSLAHRILIVCYQQNVLLVVIVGLRWCARLLRSFTSNQNFATSFFLESFLVETFWSDNHTYVVDTVILRNVNFTLQLISFMNCFQHLVLFRISVIIVNLSS